MDEKEMIKNEFHVKLTELMGEISTLPKAQRDKLTAMAAKTKHRQDKLRQTIGDLQESLDYLRLSIKYMVFDLEATRRENAYLRKLIEQNNSDQDAPETDLDMPGSP
jgi:hypothetical protein